MKKLTANYHTHTVRCGHAEGTDREYAEKAVERGLTLLGFSDHVTMPFPDGHESRFRVQRARLDDYVESVLSLREEFKGRLKILLGFEAEYYPDLFGAMRELLSAYPVDFLILGQHFNDSGESFYNTRPHSDPAMLHAYADRVLEAASTGAFSYIAHPDLPNFTGDGMVYRQEMTRLIEGCIRLDLPLELNLLGIREERNYPDPRFWEIAARLKPRVVVGCDAHRPEHVADPQNVKDAFDWLEKYGLKAEETVPLHKPF
jgi:histidinol-phosphatase (PHP family)